MWRRIGFASVLGGIIVPTTNATTSRWMSVCSTKPPEEQAKESAFPEKTGACIVGGGLTGISTVFFVKSFFSVYF